MRFLFGTRAFGRVRECDGQFLATRFFHVLRLPLVPLGSRWVTDEGEDGSLSGLELGLDPLSVVTAYLRTWGPLLGVVLAVRGAIVSCAVVMVVSLASWAWYFAPGKRAARQRLFGKALGVNVDPDFLSRGAAERLRADALAKWGARYGDDAALAALAPGEPDPEKAALGYALLRLRARLDGSEGANEAAARAEALVRAQGERLEGPKRASDVVMDGSRAAFTEIEGAPGELIPVAWYSPESWAEMRRVSVDADALHPAYEDWHQDADAAVRRLRAAGARVQQVEVDVGRMVAFAARIAKPLDRRLRARFTLDEAQRAGAGSAQAA